MLDLYYWPTPNGWKVTIFLEETGTPYTVVPVNIGKGEQFTPEFLRISPNNRMPALVDSDGPDGKPLAVFESGAILMYLGDKIGRFFPRETRARYDVVQWVMFQMGGIGPMFGQAGHFRRYAPEKIPYAIERYSNESKRLCRVLDTRLADRAFVADEYSIADMAIFPWVHAAEQSLDLPTMPHLARWYAEIHARPAVQRAVAVLADKRAAQGPITDEARSILFGDRQLKGR